MSALVLQDSREIALVGDRLYRINGRLCRANSGADGFTVLDAPDLVWCISPFDPDLNLYRYGLEGDAQPVWLGSAPMEALDGPLPEDDSLDPDWDVWGNLCWGMGSCHRSQCTKPAR